MPGDNLQEIQKKALEYILTIPQLLLLVVASFFSGHFWVYFIQVNKSNRKGEKILTNKYTMTGIGLIWNMFFLLPLYIWKHGWTFEVEGSILQIMIFSVILSGFMQFIISVILVRLNSKK